MNGITLLINLIVAIVFTIVGIFTYEQGNYLDEGWWPFIISGVTWAVFLVFLIVIPVSRIDSLSNVERINIFREVLESNRNKDSAEMNFNVFEREKILEQIDNYNSLVAEWQIKGQKWYQNKWWYHPSTQGVEYIK